MTDSFDDIPNDNPQDDAATAETAARRVAFFADARASTVVLEHTVAELIKSRNIAHGVVELNTLAGVTIAATLHKHDIPYDVMWLGVNALDAIRDAAQDLDPADYDPSKPTTLDDASYLYLRKADEVSVNPEHPYLLGAHLVVIPAMTGSGERIIDWIINTEQDQPDFSPNTMPGYLMSALEQADPAQRPQNDVIMFDVPERGLIQLTDRQYIRRTLLLSLSDNSPQDAAEPTETTAE